MLVYGHGVSGFRVVLTATAAACATGGALPASVASDAANLILQRLHDALNDERRKLSQPLTFFISAIFCTKAPRTLAELMHEADAHMSRMRGGKRDSLQIAKIDNLPALH